MKNSFKQISPNLQPDLKNLLKAMTKTMVDSSEGLIKTHKVVNDEQSIQHDPRKQEKMGKIHKDFEDTMSSFRHRFAMIMSDMKFLVDEEEPRQAIEKAAKELERKENDPIIEENLANDLNQLTGICSNVPTRNSDVRMSSRDKKKLIKNSPNREDIPSHGDKPRTILNVTNHTDPKNSRSRSPLTQPSMQSGRGRGRNPTVKSYNDGRSRSPNMIAKDRAPMNGGSPSYNQSIRSPSLGKPTISRQTNNTIATKPYVKRDNSAIIRIDDPSVGIRRIPSPQTILPKKTNSYRNISPHQQSQRSIGYVRPQNSQNNQNGAPTEVKRIQSPNVIRSSRNDSPKVIRSSRNISPRDPYKNPYTNNQPQMRFHNDNMDPHTAEKPIHNYRLTDARSPSPIVRNDRSRTPKTYRRLPNGELEEINPNQTPQYSGTHSIRQSNRIPTGSSRNVSPHYVQQGTSPYQGQVQYSGQRPPVPRSRSTTPGGTRYDVSKPHRPSYQKQTITPKRFYQGESNIFQPKDDGRHVIHHPIASTNVTTNRERQPSPAVENIHVNVVETREHQPLNNSVYVPQSFGNSVTKPISKSPQPRRDRYVERHTIETDIILQETSRPKQKVNRKRDIITSRSRTREKQTQTPTKKSKLKPETTRSIDIMPTQKAQTAQKQRRRQPSYVAVGRYSERKSPPYKERLNRSRGRTPEHSFNLSTNVSDRNNDSNIQNTRAIRQEQKHPSDRYSQFKDTTFENPNMNKSTPVKPSRNQKVFSQIEIDPRTIVEGSQIPEQPASGYTTQAESVEKTLIIEDVFLPDLTNGEYKTADIKDPVAYFRYYKSKNTGVKMNQIQRIDGMTKTNNSLFLYAPNKSAEFELNQKGLNLINTPQNGKTKVYSRVTKQDKLVTVDSQTNDLIVTDLKTGKIFSQLKGYQEPSYKFERFRPLRFAKEDQFPLWRKGGRAIALLNSNTFVQNAEFPEFWPQGFTPMFVNVSPSKGKILGYSILKNQSILSILHGPKNPSKAFTTNIKMIPNETWAGMELNTKGDVIIAAVQTGAKVNGQDNRFMKMCAYSVPMDPKSKELTPIFAKAFQEPAFRKVQMMRKIKGYDIFILGCQNNLVFVAWSGQDFKVLNSITNIYRGMIFDCVSFGNLVIPVSTEPNDTIKVFTFDKHEFDMAIRSDKKDPMSLATSKLSLKKSTFLSQSVSKLQTPSMMGTKKISISKDGRTIYFGGDGGLIVMKRQTIHKPFELLKNNPNIQYYGLRPTPSGHIVVQHKSSNTMAVYDKRCNKMVDFQAERNDMGMNYLREPHFSFEGNQIIWFGGITSLFIVDLSSLTQIKIDNFVCASPSGRAPQPLNAIADFDRQKYLVHYAIEKQQVIVFHINGREPDTHILEEIIPKFNKLKCLELSPKKLYVFAGGHSMIQDARSGSIRQKACVTALKFDKELKMQAEIVLPGSKCTTVNKIVASAQHPDILFVATDGPLFVLAFSSSQNQFEVLKAINIDSPNSTTGDMCIFNNTLYMSNGDDNTHITVVEFSGLIQLDQFPSTLIITGNGQIQKDGFIWKWYLKLRDLTNQLVIYFSLRPY